MRSTLLLSFIIVANLVGCGAGEANTVSSASGTQEPRMGQPAPDPPAELAVATFAGGCFWCMEPPFDKLEGVLATTSGYIGGPETNPTYKEVSSGRTGHTEAIQVLYDPAIIDYPRLLEVFWHNIDPTVANRQFCDWGTQYRTGIFTHGSQQEAEAEASFKALSSDPPFEEKIVTELVSAGPFWPAEEYHQDFYEKSPLRYKTYRKGCGRDSRLKELWGELAGQ